MKKSNGSLTNSQTNRDKWEMMNKFNVDSGQNPGEEKRTFVRTSEIFII